MPRSRNIKPGFFINEDLVELPFATRLLFAGLWTVADREGRLDDRPKKIKMAVFPADDVDVNEGLDQLASNDLIIRYVVDGERYIQITNFTRHQNPHQNEKPSEIPPASDCSRATPVPVVLIPDSLNSDSLIPESRVAAAKNGDHQPKKSAKKKAQTDEEFLAELQANYPYLDVAHVNRKMVSWCGVNGKQPTRRRLVNWLNREDVPVGANGHMPEVDCDDCGNVRTVVCNDHRAPCPTCRKAESDAYWKRKGR